MIFERFYWMVRETDWKHFFKKNGAGEIVFKRIRWTEQPNDISCAIVVSGEITGGYRGRGGLPGMYAAWNTDSGFSEMSPTIQAVTEQHFQSFTNPDCRCRVGMHWKCGIHGNWRG